VLGRLGGALLQWMRGAAQARCRRQDRSLHPRQYFFAVTDELVDAARQRSHRAQPL